MSYLLKMKVFRLINTIVKTAITYIFNNCEYEQDLLLHKRHICIDLSTGHNLRFGAWWGHTKSAKICNKSKKITKNVFHEFF